MYYLCCSSVDVLGSFQRPSERQTLIQRAPGLKAGMMQSMSENSSREARGGGGGE